MTTPRCCASVATGQPPYHRRCVNESTITRFGKRYCYMHTPVVRITDPNGKMKSIGAA